MICPINLIVLSVKQLQWLKFNHTWHFLIETWVLKVKILKNYHLFTKSINRLTRRFGLGSIFRGDKVDYFRKSIFGFWSILEEWRKMINAALWPGESAGGLSTVGKGQTPTIVIRLSNDRDYEWTLKNVVSEKCFSGSSSKGTTGFR